MSLPDHVWTVSLSYEIEQKYNQHQRQIKHAPLMLIKLYALTAHCREMQERIVWLESEQIVLILTLKNDPTCPEKTKLGKGTKN